MSVCKNCDYYDSCSLPEPNRKCKVNSMNDWNTTVFADKNNYICVESCDLPKGDAPADYVKVVRCKYCKHSIKKDYDVPASYEYLCILKSTVTHLEEHEANYFCADGKRRDTK